ncbi:MAG: TIGR04282 family arsenosugar biosynthesis glycosyltransferase [Paludibacter sp.]|nr:TIGR04282 family arsenosugar biosynthesis glycosyltransferase [Paludibacter sp.]
MNKTDALIVFVRNPELGKVKTRIGNEIGNLKALLIYTELLNYTIQVVEQLDVEKLVFVAEASEFSLEIKGNIQVHEQHGADLGTRMKGAFDAAFDAGFSRVVIIGSDNYEITSEIIADAFEKLKSTDCVIGPANDGGYYLLGMTRNHSALFEDIEWSTDKTLKQTIAVLENEKLTYNTLIPLNDVDKVEDVMKYTQLVKLIQEYK